MSVSNNIVTSESDNIKWTFTSVDGGGYRISYTSGNSTYYLTTSGNNNNLSLTTTSSNARTWYYDSEDKQLYYYTTSGFINQKRYIRELTGNRRTTATSGEAAKIGIALVTNEVPSGEFTYYYYTADGSQQFAASEVGTQTEDWTDVSTLAKEITGYRFLEARANSPDGNVITQVKGKSYRVGAENSGDGSYLSSIYFLYMKDYTSSGSVPAGLEGPELKKTVTDNGDGTFKIRLEIEGVTNQVKHGANVVVVFDRTSSMNGNMSNTDSTKRINAAISAVEKMVEKLKPGTGADQNDIDFALVEFDRSAEIHDFGATDGISGHTNWTKSGTALTERVNLYKDGQNLASSGATAGGGGTNWQEALQKTAAVLESKPDNDVTYVIFMTDGEPTFYIDSDEVRNNRDTTHPEYTKAVPYAKTIVDAGYHMWDIFCSAADTTLLSSLKAASGAEEYIEAESQTAIENAFIRVADAMLEAIGSQNAAAEDGVPKMGSFDLATVDGELQLSNATYYKNGEEWPDAPPAKPSSNGVEWDLSSEGTLADGAKYAIEFYIWPSQDAYDLIADLNNGLKSYDSLTADQKASLDVHSDGTYTMKTNTSLAMSYELYGETHSDNVDYEKEDMNLPTSTIIVEKYWHNDLDGREADTNVTLKVTQDGADYIDVEMNDPVPFGDSGHEWKQTPKKDIFISVGNMGLNEETKELTVHSTGHDYTVVEPPQFSYRWDLTADVYHPMIINNSDEVTVLIEVDEKSGILPFEDSEDQPISIPDKAKNLENNKTVTVGGYEYYRFGTESNLYVKQPGENVLTADNDRRSNLIINKVVSETDAPEDDLFAIQVTLDNPNDPHRGDEGYSDWYHTIWFYVSTAENDRDTIVGTDDGLRVEGATAENGDTGFWWFDNGGTVTIYIKDGWYINFNNVGRGSTYTIEELFSKMPDGYTFVKANPSVDNKQGLVSTPATITDNKAEGTIDKPNTDYKVEYTNKYEGVFYVYHSSDCSVERFPMAVKNVPYSADKTFNINALTAEGTLYGGYYSDYAGKSEGFDVAAAAALDYSKDEAPKDKDGKAYDYSYIKESGKSAWNYAKGYNVNGAAMVPAKDTVYYLKEVPDGYLRPYTHYTYFIGTGEIGKVWAITDTDDLCYSQAGFKVRTNDHTATIVAKMTIAPANNTSSTVTLTAGKIFKPKGVLDGWLGYSEAINQYIDGSKAVVQQYWKTKDGIDVFGVVQRELTFTADGEGRYTKSNITKKDTAYSAS